jgi:hypothetical protein
MKDIDHSYLLEILHYDPDAGVFQWAKPRPKIRVGQRAGTLHHRGYIYLEIDGKHCAAHRLAWFYVTGERPAKQVDHINRDKSDNRFFNLRLAEHGQNRANSRHNNKNGFKGVTHHKWLKTKPYQAQITFQKKVIYLGCYATPEEASAAYKEAAERFHGEFSNP